MIVPIVLALVVCAGAALFVTSVARRSKDTDNLLEHDHERDDIKHIFEEWTE
jgi:hypothetical protein